jgi:hypothetical protein
MRAERTLTYELHLTDFSPEIGRASAGDVLMATGPEPTVPETYRAYAGVFSEADSELMPSHSPWDRAIELLNGKQPSWGPIYKLSEKKLNILRSYLEVQLKRG